MTGFDPKLDRGSTTPLYLQVAQALEDAVTTGALRPGDRLENEVALATRLDLSRPTVRRAIQELVTRGLLVRKRGVGTQVVTGPVSRPLELFSLHDDLIRSQRRPTTNVLSNQLVQASDEVAERLDLAPGATVVRLRRLRMSEGEPLAILHNHLPHFVSEPRSADLESGGLYGVLRSAGVSIKVARQRIGARVGTIEECRLLGEPVGTTMLTVDRVALDDFGRPVEWGQHLYRSSRYSISMTVT